MINQRRRPRGCHKGCDGNVPERLQVGWKSDNSRKKKSKGPVLEGMRLHNSNVYDEPIKGTSESAAFDQASSPTKPHYALFGVLLDTAALLISIWELIYNGRKERVVLRRWGRLWWFYYPPPRNAFFVEDGHKKKKLSPNSTQ
ncbi:hypothetical protein L3X38_022649 [Prunus dulcis]|uniref:Uncharacterized protein n=1 Tax=Prunus dulcis TaxID=3755 RepID=A0AAD4VWD5_PRUDU|nr:hypothetical protein L3X38_022649 [Prunus dulcis]